MSDNAPHNGQGTPEGPGSPQVPALVVRGVSKTFGARTVLSNADLTIQDGEIRALLGQNGSGKSTLIKILSGYHEPDPGGEVLIAGEPLPFGSPAASYLLGFRFVHQDLGLISSMSVVDNIALGSDFVTRGGRIDKQGAWRRAAAALERAGFDIDPDALISDLTQAQRTGVAIARALSQPKGETPRVLVMDEPTASLPADEAAALIASLRRTAASGVAIIYVTHHLDEVFALADTVTVLRDGILVNSLAMREVDRAQLIHMLIGSELEKDYRQDVPNVELTKAEVSLQVDGLSAGPLRDVCFAAHKDEILGIYGLTGSGRETVLGAIFGSVPRLAGTVKVKGREIPPGHLDKAVSAGLGYLPADRKARGGMALLSARENLTLLTLPSFQKWSRVRRSAERKLVQEWFERLDIRPRGEYEMSWGSFSGGNQQKIVLAKWLQIEPDVLLLDEPTQGIDVGAKVAIHSQIRDACEQGTSVVISSTDEEELAAVCTRVLIIQQGRITDELTGERLNPVQLNKSMHADLTTAAQ
jgi:ribose transport system ATP-binding protein